MQQLAWGVPSEAYSINDSGQVVGTGVGTGGNLNAIVQGGPYAGDLYPNSQIVSCAYGINTQGQVVGYLHGWYNGVGGPWQQSAFMTDAFVYSAGQLTCLHQISYVDPNSAQAYPATAAYAVNDSGQAVGWENDGTSGTHALLWNISTNTTTDLGTLGGNSSALAINNSGQIVGYFSTSGGSDAFLYTGSGPMVDLNNLIAGAGWTLEEATGINDSGQIVGYGVNPSGQTHAFLLTPSPEPSTLVLLGVGAVGLLAHAWRRRRRVAASGRRGANAQRGLVAMAPRRVTR
jgi:probable HAF family extracellular repeat protein